jgi:hypothetical protein
MINDRLCLTSAASPNCGELILRWIFGELVDRNLDPGVYNGGEIILLGDRFDTCCLSSWREKLIPSHVPFAYTAFGDFFAWNERAQTIDLVDVRTLEIHDVSRDAVSWLDEFLPDDDVRAHILRAEDVRTLSGRLGPLAYLQCFVRGSNLRRDPLDDYATGDVRIHTSLVGQSAFGVRRAPRMSPVAAVPEKRPVP